MMPELRSALRVLAWNVLARRQERRLTIEKAAWDAAMAPRHWSQIEAGRGNPTLTTLVKMAVALGVELGALFSPLR